MKYAFRLAKKIRELREKKGLSIRGLSRRIGVSPAYWGRVESGEHYLPTEERIKQVAKILGCDSDELVILSGRLPSDIQEIIKNNPKEMYDLIRRTHEKKNKKNSNDNVVLFSG